MCLSMTFWEISNQVRPHLIPGHRISQLLIDHTDTVQARHPMRARRVCRSGCVSSTARRAVNTLIKRSISLPDQARPQASTLDDGTQQPQAHQQQYQRGQQFLLPQAAQRSRSMSDPSLRPAPVWDTTTLPWSWRLRTGSTPCTAKRLRPSLFCRPSPDDVPQPNELH